MGKNTPVKKTGDPLLSSNESEDARHRREFALKFPPNTPHSVINHWYAVEHATQLATIADPRKLKSERVAGMDVVESAPGVESTPTEAVEAALGTPRKSRKSRRAKKAESTSQTSAEAEKAKA